MLFYFASGVRGRYSFYCLQICIDYDLFIEFPNDLFSAVFPHLIALFGCN